jgi:hypothetical protein
MTDITPLNPARELALRLAHESGFRVDTTNEVITRARQYLAFLQDVPRDTALGKD